MKPIVKKTLKWSATVVAAPFVLTLLLAVLLYVPHVQNWAVRQVASYASQSMGMTVRVDRVHLAFPLDLGIYGFFATQPNDSLHGVTDTIADVRRLTVSVRLRPLFHSNVVVDKLEFNDVKLNTSHFVPSVRIKGRVAHLSLRSRGIDLSRETMHIDEASLGSANIDVALSDTVPKDTTSTPSQWRITVDRLYLDASAATVHMPGDTLRIAARTGLLEARAGYFDLFRGIYNVGFLDWRGGTLNYDNRYAKPQSGLDYNHMALSDISLHIDSLKYSASGLRLRLRECAMRERCGLAVRELSGTLNLDSMHIVLPDLRLRTARSMLAARVNMDFSTFDDFHPGVTHLDAKGYIVKGDFAPLLGFLPGKLLMQLPDTPITLSAGVTGNIRSMSIRQFDVTYPTVFALKASGQAHNLGNASRLKVDIAAEAHTYNLNFIVKALLPESAASSISIPSDISLRGRFQSDGPHYAARFAATQGGGSVSGRAIFDSRRQAYDATLTANRLNISNFVKGVPLRPFTGTLTARGAGFDFLSPHTRMNAHGSVASFGFGTYNLSDMKLSVAVKDGVGRALLDSHTPLINGVIDLSALMNRRKIDARLVCDLVNADFYRMGITKRPFSAALTANVELQSNLKSSHRMKGSIANIVIRDSANAYRPENVMVDAFTNRDSTHVDIASGDFALRLDGGGSIEHLKNHLAAVNNELVRQRNERYINQLRLRERLPEFSFYLSAGKDNVVSRLLKRFGYAFQGTYIDMAVSPHDGINGMLSLDSLVASGVQLDTIRLAFRSDSAKTEFEGQIRNNRYNPQFVFNARLRGAFAQSSLYLGTHIYDNRDRLGIALGLKADMEPGGVRVALGGTDPVLGYKKFRVNRGNYVFFGTNNRISADMRLMADDGMGVQIFSNDSTDTRQDLSVSLAKFDLQKVLSIVPYAPNVGGLLNGDMHYITSEEGEISVSSSLSIDRMAYEGCPIGNVASEFVYMPKDGGKEHYVDGTLSVDDYDVCSLSGMYSTAGEGHINANVSLSRTPLLLLDGFVPDRIINFLGYTQGEVNVKGSVSHPDVNGTLYFDSAYVASEPYGVKMRLCDDEVEIKNSRMQLENFQLFARNNNALTLYGYFDFADLDHMSTRLRMRADNYLLIDSKEQARSEAYGKAYVNFLGLVDGQLDNLRMRGRLDVLGSSDITYILRDSPLTTDNQLEGLVKFVNFRDTEAVSVTRPPINGLNMDLTVSIDEGAHVLCALNADQSNYVDITGGGTLRMLYTAADGLSLYGRYTIGSGEMKYSLPVIPLKTFTIKDGSYVEFMGDPMNPRLNITATEENKATVANDGGTGRSVAFECGVELTKTLKDMGLKFIIDAPDDQQMHNELMTQSVENRGKIAVTMLTTGMYLADGNTNSFSMNSALSAFLNSQINAISGNALRTLDLSFGMDNTMLGSGQMHTDYSFKFSKRFWNNRLRVVIGGKVSSGAEVENQNDTFFDNVTFEYRLSPTSNKYLKLFYNRDSYDWLEGYVEQFGGGFIWRKKMDSLKELIPFRKTKSTNIFTMPVDSAAQRNSR